MPNWLSIDLEDMFPSDEEETTTDTGWLNDMFPSDEPTEDATTETTEEAIEETTEESTEVPTEETTQEAPETTEGWSEDITGEIDELIQTTDSVVDTAEEASTDIKDSVEQVQEAVSENDSAKVQQLVDTLYEKVLEYEANMQADTVKYDVLKQKYDSTLSDLNDAKFELESRDALVVSKDPQVKILNRMYDDAIGWSDTAKERVLSALEDMYYQLTGTTIEDKMIDASLEDVPTAWIWNESWEFVPPIEEEDPELTEGLLWMF